MHGPNALLKTPRLNWKRAALVATSLAVTSGLFTTGLASTAQAASFPPVVTKSYTITGAASSVTNVSAALSSTAPGNATTSYTIRFTTPAVLPSGDTISVQCVTCTWTGVSSSVGVADLTPGNGYGAQTETPTGSGSSTLVIPVGSSGIAAGDTVQLSFTATNPGAGSYTFNVSTTASTTATASPTVTIAAASSAPSVSTTSNAIGSGDTFTFSGATLTGTASSTIVLTGSVTNGVTWSSSQYSYTVAETAPSAATLTVNSVALTSGNSSQVTITLSAPTVSGATYTITAVGTNPSSSQSDTFTIASGGDTLTTAAVTFGAAVTGVTIGATPATSGTSATWGVGFTSTDGVPAGGTIKIQGPKGTTFGTSNAVVTDTTTGVSELATVTQSTTSSTNDTITAALPSSGFSIAKGDAVTVMLYGVTNPAAGAYGGTTAAMVTTSVDPVPAAAAAFSITASSPSNVVAPMVTLSSSSPGALSNYTIATFNAASDLVAGTDTIEVSTPNVATVFPGSGYTLTDATTASGTQALTVKSGASSNDVTLSLANNVKAGDSLTLTIDNVINPPGGTYTIELGADNISTNTAAAGTEGLTGPAVPFPSASATYPNGAIVKFGTSDYVFAGGAAFAATSTELTAVQAVDHAVELTAATGATPPTAKPRTGTMIKAVGADTIYVVGTDGNLYGFASPTQMKTLGYDPAMNVTVPSLGSLTVAVPSAGADTVTAFSTGATGAIVNSSGTYYVFANGKAFGIPGLKALALVQKPDPAITETGTVTSAMTSAAIPDGTLLTVNGTAYVTSNGSLYSFVSPAELAKDGFGGTASLTVPNTGGLGIVPRPYASS